MKECYTILELYGTRSSTYIHRSIIVYRYHCSVVSVTMVVSVLTGTTGTSVTALKASLDLTAG